MPIKTNLKPGMPEFSELCKSTIGGSEIAAIQGISEYMTSLDLFLIKSGLKKNELNEFLVTQGRDSENKAIGALEKQFGVKLETGTFLDDKNNVYRITPDGFCSNLYAEVKFVGKKTEIQPQHISQVQWGMSILGIDEAHLCYHDGKNNTEVNIIKADKAYQARQRDLAAEWWENFIANKRPELSDRDYLDLGDALVPLREAKIKADAAQYEFEFLKKGILAAFKHPKISGAGVKIYKSTRIGNINYKAMPEFSKMTEDYLNQFRGKSSESWTVKLEGEK